MANRTILRWVLGFCICAALAGCRRGTNDPEECIDEDGDGELDCIEDIDCVDEDGDGFGTGRDCEGPDCDDGDRDLTVECPEHDGWDEVSEHCMDGDGDGYGEGRGCEGPDCDDTNPHCNEYCDASCLNRAGDTCDDARDIDDLNMAYAGDTSSMTDIYNLDPSLSFTGPDQVWDINIFSYYGYDALVTVFPEEGFDVALCTSNRGCSIEDFHCVNSGGAGSEERAQVRDPSSMLMVIVDGVDETSGSYTISVSETW